MTSQELIKKTQEFITIPSSSGNREAVQQALDFITSMIVARVPDVTIERFERNGRKSFLAYRGKNRPDTFDIILNGHVDVVPGPPELFRPVIKNERLYGRGALDMKGTTLVMTDVFCELVNEVPYDLALQVVSDEETGGEDGTRMQIADGVRGNFIVMAEYANHRHTIYNAARGLCWPEIMFKGKSAHGGHLWKGSNAVIKAGDFAGAVLRRYPTPDRETWTTTASIASLHTPNQAFNKVPDTAVLRIDFRFTQEDPVFQNVESLKDFIASIDPEAELSNLDVFGPAIHVDELNPYVQGLSAALQRVTGVKPKFKGRPASSDGRHYAVVGSANVVEFGIYGQNSHSDGEYAELSSFAEYQATLREFLRQPIPAQLKTAGPETEPVSYKLLRDLVAMPTVTGNTMANNKALAYIQKFLRDRRMHITEYEFEGFRSIVATTRPDTRQPEVLLSAHIDVVPANQDQFELVEKGHKLGGRGVLDMKSAVASYLALVDELKDDLAAYDFGIMITSDEEFGGRQGTKRLVEAGWRPNVVVIPDGGADWQLESFAKGVQWIKLEATGVGGHASRPWEGDSAIRKLLDALREIEQLAPAAESAAASAAPEATVLTVGTIEGGTTPNQIPVAASAMLDIRYGSRAAYERLYPQIQAVCHKFDVHETLLVSDPPCINDPENPYIKRFGELITEVIGEPPGRSFSYAATDGRYFSAVGVPCVITKLPGGVFHEDAEWLSKYGFEQFGRLLKTYVMEVAKVPVMTASAAVEKPQYVWYATYGSGLCKEFFMCAIAGGRPNGAMRTYPGCRDHTPPLRDEFIALPHELYFGGDSETWGGGRPTIDPVPQPTEHTISRAYLVTLEQFTEILAQENLHDQPSPLPLTAAREYGHATIGDGSGSYDELVYCGEKDGYPVFSATATRPRRDYVAPSPGYIRALALGLAQDKTLDTQEAIDYLLHAPGMSNSYKASDLSAMFQEPVD